MNHLLRKIALLVVALSYLSATAQHVGGLHAEVLAGGKSGQHAGMHHAGHAENAHSPGDDAASHKGTAPHGMKMVGCGLACAGVFAPTDPASARAAHPARYSVSGRHGLALPPAGVEPPPPRA